MESNDAKKVNRVVITLNDEEYKNFDMVRKNQGKTFQMLGYLALLKANLITRQKIQKDDPQEKESNL